MNRLRKTKDPCSGCGLHKDLCICAEIVPTTLDTKLSLIIHHRETKRTTNTGMLATKLLSNSQTIVRGLIGQPVDLTEHLDPKYHTLLLYPSNDAEELNESYLDGITKPIHLLVPDGNWRQASKVHYRHKELGDVPRVFVPKPDSSMDSLRKESKVIGMPTLMAIALALGVIEGKPVQDILFNLLRHKLDNTLKGRGH